MKVMKYDTKTIVKTQESVYHIHLVSVKFNVILQTMRHFVDTIDTENVFAQHIK